MNLDGLRIFPTVTIREIQSESKPQRVGSVVRTMVPLTSRTRGLGIALRFPIFQESKIESTSATTLRATGVFILLSSEHIGITLALKIENLR